MRPGGTLENINARIALRLDMIERLERRKAERAALEAAITEDIDLRILQAKAFIVKLEARAAELANVTKADLTRAGSA